MAAVEWKGDENEHIFETGCFTVCFAHDGDLVFGESFISLGENCLEWFFSGGGRSVGMGYAYASPATTGKSEKENQEKCG